jgi:hypothetical protein
LQRWKILNLCKFGALAGMEFKKYRTTLGIWLAEVKSSTQRMIDFKTEFHRIFLKHLMFPERLQ